MPTIAGSKLFAIGQVLLQEDPSSMLLVSPIWNSRSNVLSGDEAPSAPEYQWQYNVNIPHRDAQRIRSILWSAAQASTKSMKSSAPLTVELAELWDGICEKLSVSENSGRL